MFRSKITTYSLFFLGKKTYCYHLNIWAKMFILFETLENSRISEARTHWSISSLGLW